MASLVDRADGEAMMADVEGAVESHVYKTATGCEIRLDAYPASRPGSAPVVVWIHGGALIMGSRERMQPTLRALCARAGFAQVSIDYRLAPETKLPAIVDDVVDAFAWIRSEGPARFGADPTRVAAMGFSGGGYLALIAGQRVQPRLSAVVSYYGYGDIVGAWYSQPDSFYRTSEPLVTREEARAAVGEAPLSEGPRGRRPFYLYCRQQGLWPGEVGGMDLARLEAFCPERHVGADDPPTLLAHGTGDTDVPYQRSADVAAALEREGVDHQLLTIPDGRHGFDGPVEVADLEGAAPGPEAAALLRTVAFLRERLTPSGVDLVDGVRTRR
jgi:acetyl esterase/lipase